MITLQPYKEVQLYKGLKYNITYIEHNKQVTKYTWKAGNKVDTRDQACEVLCCVLFSLF